MLYRSCSSLLFLGSTLLVVIFVSEKCYRKTKIIVDRRLICGGLEANIEKRS